MQENHWQVELNKTTQTEEKHEFSKLYYRIT